MKYISPLPEQFRSAACRRARRPWKCTTDSAGVALGIYAGACPPARRSRDRGNNFSRRSGLTYANNASMSYGYTTAGDLTSLAEQMAANTYDVTYTLGYTGAHELTSDTTPNAKFVFQNR